MLTVSLIVRFASALERKMSHKQLKQRLVVLCIEMYHEKIEEAAVAQPE